MWSITCLLWHTLLGRLFPLWPDCCPLLWNMFVELILICLSVQKHLTLYAWFCSSPCKLTCPYVYLYLSRIFDVVTFSTYPTLPFVFIYPFVSLNYSRYLANNAIQGVQLHVIEGASSHIRGLRLLPLSLAEKNITSKFKMDLPLLTIIVYYVIVSWQTLWIIYHCIIQ